MSVSALNHTLARPVNVGDLKWQSPPSPSPIALYIAHAFFLPAQRCCWRGAEAEREMPHLCVALSAKSSAAAALSSARASQRHSPENLSRLICIAAQRSAASSLNRASCVAAAILAALSALNLSLHPRKRRRAKARSLPVIFLACASAMSAQSCWRRRRMSSASRANVAEMAPAKRCRIRPASRLGVSSRCRRAVIISPARRQRVLAVACWRGHGWLTACKGASCFMRARLMSFRRLSVLYSMTVFGR